MRHGYAKLTTNRIAERAGVNIASLYQYFPGKEAIVAELRRRHGTEERVAVRNALLERRGEDLESTVRVLVSMGVAAHAGAPELHRVFTEELPALRVADVSAIDPAAFDEFRRFLRAAATDVPDTELAMWMVATIAGAVIHRATVERRAVARDILHFRARVLAVYGKRPFMGSLWPRTRFWPCAERTRFPVLPVVASKTHGPAGLALIRPGQHSVVMRRCRVTDMSRRPPIGWP